MIQIFDVLTDLKDDAIRHGDVSSLDLRGYEDRIKQMVRNAMDEQVDNPNYWYERLDERLAEL